MRTLGFRTHVLLSIAAAAALVLSLDRLWYAPAPKLTEKDPSIGDIHGPLNQLGEGVQRWLTSSTGTPGWDILGHWGIAIAAMAGVAGLGALACLAPALQPLGRDLLRYGALAAFAITAWKLFDPPGSNAVAELRHGALAGAGAALVLLVCGMSVAAAPLRRRRAPRVYHAPPPPQPPAYGTSGSSAPPGA